MFPNVVLNYLNVFKAHHYVVRREQEITGKIRMKFKNELKEK